MRACCLLVIAVTACTADPTDTCGDGVLQDGENGGTCCLDAGCERGVCDLEDRSCVQPWTFTCQSPGCATEQPYLCEGSGPPAYNCNTCGCPDGTSCVNGICYSTDTIALERIDSGPPRNLPLDDYFDFVDTLSQGAGLTYSELQHELDSRLSEDNRRAGLLIGESHGSDAEQAVGLQLITDLQASWGVTTAGIEWGGEPILDPAPLSALGIASHFIDGDLTNGAHCADAVAEAGTLLNNIGMYVQYSGSGHTSQEICYHGEHWSICDLPHTAECLLRAGRRAVTVILFDPDVWLWLTDLVLLWRVGDLYPDSAAVEAQLNLQLARWQTSADAMQTEARYDTAANGTPLNVKFVEATHADDVFVAFFPRPARPAFLMRAFGGVWADDASRDFLLSHDIRPGDCSISWDRTPGSETFWLWCNNGGYELHATVDGISFALTSAETVVP